MCFPIDKNARKWTQNRVYKAVRLVNGKPRSPYHFTRWHKGEVKRRSCGPTEEMFLDRCPSRAAHGIYVYRTLNAAVDNKRGAWSAVLVLEVDPSDFICTDGKDKATYDKVRVADEQPYIEWVE